MAIPHRDVEVAVDPVEVRQVELLEGLAVTHLGALDELADADGFGRGRNLGHDRSMPAGAGS